MCNDDSLGEQIQREFPSALVVKALNTLNCELMVNPSKVPGDHVLFIAGNDADAKAKTVALLWEFGWPAERVLDLGDISAARATEMYLPLWLRLIQSLGHANFNISVLTGNAPLTCVEVNATRAPSTRQDSRVNQHVDSEVGQLKRVILHRPGLELARLTPDNVHSLLFDDVMWAERAREEHDAFAEVLRLRGVKVHCFADLLADVLAILRDSTS